MKRSGSVMTGILAGTGLLTGAYLFSIAPPLKKNPLAEELARWDYAHRGLYDNAWGIPENSIAAFMNAVNNGYGMELDIHLTADGKLVVIHDNELARMCHIDRKVSEMTWAELRHVRLLGTTETIPLFEDVLRVVDGKTPLIVELKVDDHNHNQLCAAAWSVLSKYQGLYCIESFHPLAVAWFRKNHPEVVRGQLAIDFSKNPMIPRETGMWALGYLLQNMVTRPDFVAYGCTDMNNISFRLYKHLFKGMTVVWTVHGEREKAQVKNLGHVPIFELPGDVRP